VTQDDFKAYLAHLVETEEYKTLIPFGSLYRFPPFKALNRDIAQFVIDKRGAIIDNSANQTPVSHFPMIDPAKVNWENFRKRTLSEKKS